MQFTVNSTFFKGVGKRQLAGGFNPLLLISTFPYGSHIVAFNSHFFRVVGSLPEFHLF
jgi:hypothetical protein